MTTTQPKRSAEETGRLGKDVYNLQVRPRLLPENDNKFVVIDILSGDYEVDADDYEAASPQAGGRILG